MVRRRRADRAEQFIRKNANSIRATRQEYAKEGAKPLPPIHFAGLLLEGGILTYDANELTGGVGANFLGVGASAQYRRDIVTVGARIVSVQTGEVLISATTTKTVYSVGIDGNAYRFVSLNGILQAEVGVTRNEPTQLAVRQAIDLAVYSSIMEGVRKEFWTFADPARGRVLVQEYLDREQAATAGRKAVRRRTGAQIPVLARHKRGPAPAA